MRDTSEPLPEKPSSLGWLAARNVNRAAVRAPETEERMFRYRVHSPDGDDLGEATYAMMIQPGEEIHLDAGRRFRVIDVVPFDEDELPFVGPLQVEAA